MGQRPSPLKSRVRAGIGQELGQASSERQTAELHLGLKPTARPLPDRLDHTARSHAEIKRHVWATQRHLAQVTVLAVTATRLNIDILQPRPTQGIGHPTGVQLCGQGVVPRMVQFQTGLGRPSLNILKARAGCA